MSPSVSDIQQETRMIFADAAERTAYVSAECTAIEARTRNLELVCGALESADCDYFLVRGLEDASSTVGVPESIRHRVLTTLADLMSRVPGYIRVVLPHGVGRNPILSGSAASSWQRVATAHVIRLYWYWTDSTQTIVQGRVHGCDIEFWEDTDSRLSGPRANRCTRTVDASAKPVAVDPNRLTRLASQLPSGRTMKSLRDFVVTLPDEVTFPIDAVYTWVDGADADWAAKRASNLGLPYHAESSSAARYLNRNELKYSLRSIHMFAPWIRRIYIITDEQTPEWLCPTERVQLVDHREIFEEPSWLPTYNSHAIETQLHHIAGLSEHFIYFNDDMFIGRPITPNLFFLSNGTAKYFPSQSRVPQSEIHPDDTPVDAACKNNRRILEADFGVVITQSMQHVPYALRRSVLDELETRYRDAYVTTATSRTRSPSDHSFTSSLHQYYSMLTGRGMAGTARYGYIQLAVPDLAQRLARLLLRRDWDTFCLNDAYSSVEQLESQVELLTPFLEQYFPIPAPWETMS